MALLNVRLYIKSKEKTMDVLYALKNYGVDTKNLFTQLKEKGYFELKLANELIEKLQNELGDAIDLKITDTEIKKSENKNISVESIETTIKTVKEEKILQSPAGTLVLLLFDVFVILSILEIFSKSIDLTNLIKSIVHIDSIALILEVILKIAVSFIFIKGILDIANTTILGKFLNVNIEEGKKNFSLMMYLVVISYYLLNSNLIVLKYFGLFLLTFIIIAVFFAYEYLGIALRKHKD